jgi:hypothetical protein
MELVNLIFILIGILTALIGAISYFVPNVSRLINFPGGPRLKASVAIIAGIILIIIGLFVEIQ